MIYVRRYLFEKSVANRNSNSNSKSNLVNVVVVVVWPLGHTSVSRVFRADDF